MSTIEEDTNVASRSKGTGLFVLGESDCGGEFASAGTGTSTSNSNSTSTSDSNSTSTSTSNSDNDSGLGRSNHGGTISSGLSTNIKDIDKDNILLNLSVRTGS